MVERELFYKNYKLIKRVINNSCKSPFYSKCYKEVGLDLTGDFEYEDFVKIPILDKNTYRSNVIDTMVGDLFELKMYNKFCGDTGKRREFLKHNRISLKITSGSTGIPLEILKSDDDNNRDYLGLNYYRAKMSNYRFKGKFLWIWPVNPLIRKHYYSDDDGSHLIKINQYGYQYMMYEYSSEAMNELYRLLKDGVYEWISASPTALTNFALYMEKSNLFLNNIFYIECHSEFLSDWQAELITRRLGTLPVSIYSSNEVQFMGGRCVEGNRYHLFTRNCYLEFIKNRDGVNEVVVTSLNYLDFPIIRYNLGDCGKWINENKCTCNLSSLPTFELSEFRINDFLIKRNGSRIEPFVITDSIILVNDLCKTKITRYRVEQHDYGVFIYYLPKSCQNIGSLELSQFLEDYLSELLHEKVKVVVRYKEIDFFISNCSKYKYFEINSHFLKVSNSTRNSQRKDNI